MLAKEMKIPEGLEKVLVENNMVLPKTNINEVKAFDMEVQMENIRNRGGIVQDLGAESRCCFCSVRFGSGSQERLGNTTTIPYVFHPNFHIKCFDLVNVSFWQ